ncbi:uncharacterized protein LOC116852238 isoform X2 [Odontomachus brunneus]|nr:uncharacterized protein LOC116852238 isoform X2 [Odontomachus brunneus]
MGQLEIHMIGRTGTMFLNPNLSITMANKSRVAIVKETCNRDHYLKLFEMRTRLSLIHFFGCLLLIAVVGTANTYAEPEPMARPTRPKAIASPEELERYFDLVRDYYSLRRARYGKRGGDAAPRMSELNATWETLKTILDTQRQNQQRRLSKLKPSKEQEVAYRDYHSLDADRHASRVATRPGYLLDAVGRYYDDVQ